MNYKNQMLGGPGIIGQGLGGISGIGLGGGSANQNDIGIRLMEYESYRK